MKKFLPLLLLVSLVTVATGDEFNAEKDLLSLHYDHAPDKDDGQSAAADLTVLDSLFGKEWLGEHVVPVSGTYGKNAKSFNPKSDVVMDATWGKGNWYAAHTNKKAVVAELANRWQKTLNAGGNVWVKEGGQSDVTYEVVKILQKRMPKLDTKKRIHVVQHSNWNENQTTPAALAFTKKECNYIRIKDANRYLNVRGGNAAFEKVATSHPKYGKAWKAAFSYYPPKQRLDFSDTGELLHLLGLGELGIEPFQKRFF